MTGRFLVALIGVITGFALTQVASAADMPTKAPVYSPPPPPVYGWTGPYIGLSLGWIGSYNRITDVDGLQGPAGEQHKYHSSGITGGVYAGYNWQVTNWVLGVEGDFSGTSAKSSVVIDDDDFDSSATT